MMKKVASLQIWKGCLFAWSGARPHNVVVTSTKDIVQMMTTHQGSDPKYFRTQDSGRRMARSGNTILMVQGIEDDMATTVEAVVVLVIVDRMNGVNLGWFGRGTGFLSFLPCLAWSSNPGSDFTGLTFPNSRNLGRSSYNNSELTSSRQKIQRRRHGGACFTSEQPVRRRQGVMIPYHRVPTRPYFVCNKAIVNAKL